MSGYTPSVKFEHEFDGDIISYELTRLNRKEMMILTSVMLKVSEDGTLEAAEAMSCMIDMLPEHVSNFTGPKDSNGNAVPLDIVTTDSYFIELATTMGTNLMEASKMGADGKKKKTSKKR